MKISGIYSIINVINGKVYYGSSSNIRQRWVVHKSYLNKNKHGNKHLQNAWNKYGADAFRFEIEEEISKENLQEVEQQYLDWIKVMPKEWFYNISISSDCPMRGRTAWNKGKYMSMEFRNKLSLSKMGMPPPNKGIPMTEKQKKKQSIIMSGRLGKHIDKKEYSFKNNITNDIFIGTRSDFFHKYGFKQYNISDLVNGKLNSYKGWILCNSL